MEIKFIFNNSREMPAFGVALHDDTIEAMKNGVWLELTFDKIYTHNEMVFEKLLIKVEENLTGFNIIRFYGGQYQGRCFYIDLVNYDTSKLYDMLVF